jgi:GNAT superfamily N-acetyltransferase
MIAVLRTACTLAHLSPLREVCWAQGIRVEIADVGVDDGRLSEVFRVLVQLRPHIDEDGFRQIYRAGHPEGLRFTGVFEESSCVGVAGWRIVNTTFAIRKLTVDDLVTDAAARSKGYGHALLEYLVRVARASECTLLDLDSGVQRFAAHRFYLRERMDIAAHHFNLPLGLGVAPTPRT